MGGRSARRRHRVTLADAWGPALSAAQPEGLAMAAGAGISDGDRRSERGGAIVGKFGTLRNHDRNENGPRTSRVDAKRRHRLVREQAESQ
jgi:hypothetical protein